MSVVVGNAQDIGERERQEDYFLSKKIGEFDVAVLADGMGGYEGGDQASATVTQGVISFIEQHIQEYHAIPDLLVDATYSANASLARAKEGTNSNMGTTLIVVMVRDNHAWWVSVGDSLLYLWRNGSLKKINAYHSHYQDLRQKVFLGKITTEQASQDPEREGLTSALMGREMAHVDVSRFGIELKDGDIFLIASDGLETLPPEEFVPILRSSPDPQQIADLLVRNVVEANAEFQDNVTVLTLGINSEGRLPEQAKPHSNGRKKKSSFGLLFLLLGLMGGICLGFFASKLIKVKTEETITSPPTTLEIPSPLSQEKVVVATNLEPDCQAILQYFETDICGVIPDDKKGGLQIEYACNKAMSDKKDEICSTIAEQQEIERQQALQKQQEIERQQALQKQQEIERQQALQKQQEIERQQALQKQQEIERQQALQKQQEIERQQALQKQQEIRGPIIFMNPDPQNY